MTAAIGILMLGKISVGMRRIEKTPRNTISAASMMKVYGRCSATLTIHIVYSGRCLASEGAMGQREWEYTGRRALAQKKP